MVSFDNTETAFADRTDSELNRAHLLFKLVGNPTLVKVGKAALNLALALKLPVRGIIRSTVFNHFCGGEHITDCESTIERLHASGIYTLLDYSAEGKETTADFEYAATETIATVRMAHQDPRVPFSVFKPTGIIPYRLLAKKNAKAKFNQEEELEWKLAMERVKLICEAGKENNVPIFIDAEETWFQDAIDEMVEGLMETYNREKAMVYNTIQLYRKDRLQYLKDSFAKAEKNGYKLGVKLVRGAYMEKERERAKEQGYPSPIHATKADTDRDYDLALKFCIENHPNIEVLAGTHNEKSSKYLAELMVEKGLKGHDAHIFFSQLYGMSDNISFNLAANGYNVVKYVPYGPVLEVMPYLIRRAEENTSIAGQTGRELSLIIKEKARRRAS
ncbi:MAG: proline dehydrogenase family protein [Flavobacteriales bacterium]|nr:proline dehydrogenase family protein [Flavobacteriales bacterium]